MSARRIINFANSCLSFQKKKTKKKKQTNADTIKMEKDYFQELARSAFADMLHDKERNIKYSLAIKEAIDYMKSQGNDANVLGTYC